MKSNYIFSSPLIPYSLDFLIQRVTICVIDINLCVCVCVCTYICLRAPCAPAARFGLSENHPPLVTQNLFHPPG